ncbi:MAG: hypothetical protein MJ177_01985 [Clostridia bacterium]|nr:hypothetical protein [Clostridia bacterium]
MNVIRNKTILRVTALVICLAVLFTSAACEKNKIVKFDIPALFLNENALADLAAYCEANGYLDAELDEKHETVKISMTGTDYEVFMIKMGMTTMSTIAKMVESDTFPYFLEIGDYEPDFSSITVKVDGKKYRQDSTASLLAMTISESCLMYLTYTTVKKPKCTVTVVDSKTGEELYKETFSSAENK